VVVAVVELEHLVLLQLLALVQMAVTELQIQLQAHLQHMLAGVAAVLTFVVHQLLEQAVQVVAVTVEAHLLLSQVQLI
jgi:hypothetical protein